MLPILCACCLLGWHGAAALAKPPQSGEEFPEWQQVEELVQRHFLSQPGYESRDLIFRSQAEPVFKKLEAIGWKVADQAEILDLLPKDGDFIVKELRTTSGRKFMRSIASYPDVYDRLDRLSKLPEGHSSIRTLIKGPGGYKLLEYLTSPVGGKQAAELLSNSPAGRDFGRHTGRLYTAEAFVRRIAQSYEAAKHPAEAGKGNAQKR